MSENWEYNCPQYVDFARVDQMDDTSAEAFFENCDLDTPESNESQDSVQLNRLQPYECSVRYQSTNVATTQTSAQNSSLSSAVVSSTSNIQIKKKIAPRVLTAVQPTTSMSSSYQGRRIAKARRVSQQSSVESSNVKKVPEKPTKKVVISEPKPAVPTKGRKRSGSFVNPRPLKKKFTCPTTPNCLKRSMKKPNKNLKSSEQIELERIAELRKQMGQHLKSNKVTMKKIIRPSVLKPLLPSAQVKNSVVKKRYSLKKAEVEKGKGFIVSSGKRFGNKGFSFKPPKPLGKEREATTSTALEASVVQSPGLHRCSTPFSARRKPIGNEIPKNKKEVTTTTTVRSRLNSETQVSTKNNKVPINQNKISRSKTEIAFPQKQKTTSSLSHGPVSKTNVKPLLRKTLEKKAETFQVPKPLVPKMAGYAGIPFITKPRGRSNSMIVDANSSIASNKNMEVKPTPRKTPNVKSKNVLQSEGSEVLGSSRCGRKTQPAFKKEATEIVVNTPISPKISKSSPTTEMENSINRKADKKAKAWRKKVEDEIQQQKKKLLLKRPQNVLLRSEKISKNPLADISNASSDFAGKSFNKYGRRANLRRSLTDSTIAMGKGRQLRNNATKI